ncbi:MAG: zinc finger protein [Mucilaginibacter sp.]|nr:zinc finger protein [Mucilaginibacter sp.]
MTNNNLTRFVPQRIMYAAGENFDYCPLDGDIPLLQFINTHTKRGTLQAKNYLKTYRDFLTWSYETRLIGEDTFDILELEAYCYRHEADGIINRVLIVRENLYELVYCFMHDEPVSPAVTDELNAENDDANKHVCYAMTPNGLAKEWRDPQEELAFPLWIVIKKAIRFLTSKDIQHIKKCHCGNLYLDTTKNRNRRYCNPLTCGSIRRSKQYLERIVNG